LKIRYKLSIGSSDCAWVGALCLLQQDLILPYRRGKQAQGQGRRALDFDQARPKAATLTNNKANQLAIGP
jgi:hypothetical protein